MSNENESSVAVPIGSAIRALKLEYKSLLEEPVEGFRVKLVDDDNLFKWEVAIFGPPDTIYQGGYFKAHMQFPQDYPYNPPLIRFIGKFWHPNVFPTGGLCISILIRPGDGRHTHLKATEKWSPAQNVRTVLLSVISLLSEPNTGSPANVEACNMYNRWRASNGADDEYAQLVKRHVELTKKIAALEGVVVPTTVEEYCKVGHTTLQNEKSSCDDIVETIDYYVDQGDDDDDEDDNEDEGNTSLDESDA